MGRLGRLEPGPNPITQAPARSWFEVVTQPKKLEVTLIQNYTLNCFFQDIF